MKRKMKSLDVDVEWLDYAVFYPAPGEPGFDGVHYGGVKGVKPDAPAWAKKKFEERAEAEKQGYKL